MANRNSAIAIGKQICTLFDVGALGAMPDRGLLDHFARGGETSEAAFATLVERHGTMVLRVCRQLLADGHLAEDAFQVTFLLLARRARSIHDPDALAGWLHRVARRVAIRALGKTRRRNDRERPEAVEIAVAADNPLERDELCAIVHEEIDRLSDTQRLPIVLCALEGLSHEEAAQRLRWPVGTVKSRLVRGRRRLEGRLARRGLAPALALVAGVAAKPAVAATVPLALAVAATRAALQAAAAAARSAGSVSASVSPSIALLFQKELSAMFLAKLELAAFLALAACASAVIIVMTLAGPPARRTQGIGPPTPQASTSAANAGAERQSCPRKSTGASPRPILVSRRTQPAIPDGEMEIPTRDGYGASSIGARGKSGPCDPRWGSVPEGAAAARRRTGPRSRRRPTPGRPAWSPWRCCRPARCPTHRRSARRSTTSAISGRSRSAQHLRHLAADDGFCRRRSGPRPTPAPGQRRMAGRRADQARRADGLARDLDVFRQQDPGRRQLQYPVRAARASTPPAKWASRSTRRSGCCPASISSNSRIGTAAGGICPVRRQRPEA